jgi:hypothetical protein
MRSNTQTIGDATQIDVAVAGDLPGTIFLAGQRGKTARAGQFAFARLQFIMHAHKQRNE